MTSNGSVSEMVERTLLDDVEHFLCGIDDATADGLLTRLAEARASSQAQSDDVVERLNTDCITAFARWQRNGVPGLRDELDLRPTITAALSAIPPAGGVEERLREALYAQGQALAAFVNLLKPRVVNVHGIGEVLSDLHDWERSPTKDEVQAALKAQNLARATLNESSAIGGGDGR